MKVEMLLTTRKTKSNKTLSENFTLFRITSYFWFGNILESLKVNKEKIDDQKK